MSTAEESCPFEIHFWNDDPNDTTGWVDADEAKAAYEACRAEAIRQGERADRLYEISMEGARLMDQAMKDRNKVYRQVEEFKAALFAIADTPWVTSNPDIPINWQNFAKWAKRKAQETLSKWPREENETK